MGYPAQALNYLFLGCFLLTGNCLTFTFTGTAIGTGTLTTNWQTFTMTETTVAGDIKQTLNTHLRFRAKLALNFKFIGNGGTNSIQLFIIPLINFFVNGDSSLL